MDDFRRVIGWNIAHKYSLLQSTSRQTESSFFLPPLPPVFTTSSSTIPQWKHPRIYHREQHPMDYKSSVPEDLVPTPTPPTIIDPFRLVTVEFLFGFLPLLLISIFVLSIISFTNRRGLAFAVPVVVALLLWRVVKGLMV
ncbi:hypothetical protein TWF718_007548 [Orbilia javanica]|uniref:Transmembrane protein n=1 Tax=Orbilia javanica TaxID=47235 RepID=A0AAN8RJ64_9PEZI